MAILLDGSAGTALWAAAERNGAEKCSVWRYSIEHPEFVLELHKSYIDAGCEMIQANTFSLNRQSAARESDIPAPDIVKAAVELAKSAVSGTNVKVYAPFGPLLTLMEPYGSLTGDEVADIYTELASAAVSAGADALVLETFTDLRMAAAAAKALRRFDVPLICSMTFEKRRRTMMGDRIQTIVDTLTPLGIDGIGMNCSAGPVEALGIIRDYHDCTDLPLYYKPNSGMGESYDARRFAGEVKPALPIVSYVGGCCGCDSEYIKELGKLL